MAQDGDDMAARAGAYDARRHPAQLVRRLHQRGAQLFTQNVQRPGLSVTQFVALVTLLREGPMAQSRLGRATSMDPSTTTLVVRKLARDGLIARLRDPGDRRTTMLSLTEAGRACAEAHVPISLRAGDDLLAPLSGIERVLFLELLRKLLEAEGPDSPDDAPPEDT
ncbi:MarR family winged helix-turn-helix transcriptional regulator [Mangrovicoccus algicola]|uniref:MarR family transcriptional regulator n=1 Tax=Mangrovicoccus algicola TaxID=2771008 RepID=A0A8J6ZB99_9RHOB|nr:MarR family transcriptional regulator [Mangrovicoccus algicola]MBE3639596.1 MarR family transcriptional regulator [Mangrovicoccus algicola]